MFFLYFVFLSLIPFFLRRFSGQDLMYGTGIIPEKTNFPSPGSSEVKFERHGEVNLRKPSNPWLVGGFNPSEKY